jgi:hypothetical protein
VHGKIVIKDEDENTISDKGIKDEKEPVSVYLDQLKDRLTGDIAATKPQF